MAWRIRLTVCGLALLLASCGAGLVTGAVASNQGGNTAPPARPPVLTVPEPRFPLQPASAANAQARTVVLANAALPANANLQVQVRADAIAVAQRSPVVLFGQSASTVIGFQLDTVPFAAAFGTTADRPATLAVLVDGREVAAPVPVLLVRQPSAALQDPTQRLLLSPLGGTRARLLVAGLRSPDDVQMTVTTRDASGQAPEVTRVCSGLQVAAVDPDTALVTAEVPGSTFAGAATLVVEDRIAGRSTPVTQVFYEPEIDVVLPGQGPATGGTLVTLIGRALAPLDFTLDPPAPDFDRVHLSFRKGGRTTALLASELRRAESAVDRLVFTMPPSPDGRPGTLQIEVSIDVDAPATAPVTVQSSRFLFGSREPVFGPRGAVLDAPPVAVAPIELENAPATGGSPDFAVVYSVGGVGYLQLLAAQENGMFTRFGPPQRLGNPEVGEERTPRDLATGDLDGDQVPDCFVANEGAGASQHHLVLGQAAPLPPLGALQRVASGGGIARCRMADFDGDGRLDILLVPGAAAANPQPRVLLSRAAVGAPQFVDAGSLPTRAFVGDAVEVADLDLDGRLDVALLGGGAQPRLDIGYGRGDGTFAVATQLDLAIPGYAPDAASPAVGIHRIRGSGNPALAVVLAGLPPTGAQPPHPTTPAVVAVLEQPQLRAFAAPRAAAGADPGNVLALPIEPLGASLGADLDGEGREELVIGVRDSSAFPLGLLRFQPAQPGSSAHFTPIAGGIQQGSEPIRRITALHFGIASPADPLTQRAAVRAVFVVHESETDGVPERRLSTLLVFDSGAPPPANGLTLLSADAGGPLAAPMQGIATGNFRGVSSAAKNGLVAARDLALATGGGGNQAPGVLLLGNDGFGGFAPSLVLRDARIVPQSVVRVPAAAASGAVDALAYLADDGTVGLWRPDAQLPSPQQPTWRIAADLRQLSTDPRLQNAAIDPTSVLSVADVDGDQLLDLVVLLRLQVPAPRGEGDALLVVLRGRSGAPAGQAPFRPATAAVAVHGNATAIALADFVPEPQSLGRTQLELALAVPSGAAPGGADGDHVRFYRLAVPGVPETTRYVRSFAPGGGQVLLAGSRPTRIAAADFDRDGTADLLVAAEGDAQVRLYLNSGAPAADPAEVAIEAFHESFASPVPASPGTPSQLRLGDINSDGNVDVLLSTEARTATGARSTAVAFYLGSGTGRFDGPTFVSRTRLGDRDAQLVLDLADCNSDGVPDIAVGWSTFGSGDRNVRVLFGGSR